ncbi:MAG TPA: condensation domain-containing protein, partial [Candidatus Binatia bacterium]|nr:condensation domain-containing protein [Candidatus Binatia bacterium]
MAERSKNGALAAARRKLLTRLLEKSGTDRSAGDTPAEPGRGEGVLSFAQERLWFLDQLHPGSPVCNISRALRLTGRLDTDALERAVNEIVRRHEVLRATFPSINGKAVQNIAAELPIALRPIDLRGLPTKGRSAAMSRLLNCETAAPFDLARGPLIKMRLIKRAKNDHLLLLVLHQMICDGWSISLLLRELGKLYSAFVKNQTVVLAEPPITYSQYAERQRSSLQEERLQSQLAYWKKRLSGSAAALALPSDHPRPKVQTFRGARFPFTISSKLVRALRRCGSEEGATLFMTLMAAFNVLLSRYSNQEDISVGFPVANRRDADTEDLIGAFVNTLVLRTDLSGKPSFRELLRRVRTHCQDALARRDLPFEKLVEERQGERDLSRNPLFQVMFAYQNHPAAEFKVPGVRAELVELAGATAKFDLTLTLSECGRGLRGFFEYSTDLFEEPTIERLARHFMTLLCGIAAHPERSIEELPLLSKDERARILVQWNRTAAGYAKDRCMHELFELQAKRTPAACAVECAGASVTYDELNRRANQLACYLRELGIGPDEPVGICLERSVDMVIVLLAILKAGGAYLPLDPAYPPDRLRFMLADARVSLLITRGNLVEEGRWTSVLSEVEGIENRYLQSSILSPRPKVVCLDRDAPLFKQQSAKNLNVRIDSENLAYVIYTSGSSGAPKGVAIEHRNAVAFLYWAKQVFSAEQLAGVLASTSICFDLSVFEIFAPLSWGGRVILAPNVLALQDSAALGKVTLINTVPSALEELLDLGGLPPSTRTVNLAGESLKTELVRRIYGTGRVEKVYDLYGPSETTTY